MQPLASSLLIAWALAVAGRVAAQEPDVHPDQPSIEFSHPLVTESPSPDTKLRLDVLSRAVPDAATSAGTSSLEGEYAFHPWVSLALTVPYEWTNTPVRRAGIGPAEVSLKFAAFPFADRGILFGGGITGGLPTGADVPGTSGAHIVDMEPFLDVAARRGRFEWVGFTTYSASTNLHAGDLAERDLTENLSTLCHLNTRSEALLEFDAAQTLAGDGQPGMLNASPGLKLLPFANRHIMLGASLRVPLTRSRHFDRELLVSGMYHF